MESIKISNACGCMCTDLVGSNSMSHSHGFFRSGISGMWCDDPEAFKVTRYGLGVVCYV